MAWSAIRTIVPPADEPILTEDARLQCRIDGDEHDDLLEDYILAARCMLEGDLGIRLITQTVSFETTRWADLHWLPVGPIASIISVITADPVLPFTGFKADLVGIFPSLSPASAWPVETGGRIVVTAVAGFGSPEDLPANLRAAVKVLVRCMFDNGGAILPPVERTVRALAHSFDRRGM